MTKCLVDACHNKRASNNFCTTHIAQIRTYGRITSYDPPIKPKTCSVELCSEPHKGYGFCQKHYRQFKKYGRIIDYDVPQIHYLDGEIFKSIKGYEDAYKVSNMGRLFICRTGSIASLKQNKNGYVQVRLSKNANVERYYIHRLVLETFVGNPENKPQVDHINTIRDDNRLDNLRWVTVSENLNNELSIKKKMGKNNKVYGTGKRVKGTNLDTGEEVILISTHGWEKNGYNAGAIYRCCKGIQKTYKNYKWEWL